MTRLFALAAVSLAGLGVFAAGAARAVAGGDLDVLTKGRYVCELPGDAGDPGVSPGRRQPDQDFEVTGDSGYRVRGERGVYLLTGDHVVMTSGPFRGRSYHRAQTSYLFATGPDGKDTELRCVTSTQETALLPPPADERGCKTRRDARDPALAARAADAAC